MKFLKRGIVLFLILAMIMPAAYTSAAQAESAEENDGYYTALMYDLGIFKNGMGLQSYDEPMTRGAAARAAAEIFLDSTEGGSCEFSDIENGTALAGAVNAVVNLQLMNGYTNGRFSPETALTCDMATRIIIELLGQRVKADEKGGWPNGYRMIAEKEKIYDGVSARQEDGLLTEDFARMMYNAFDAEFLKVIAWGNPDKKMDPKADFLETYFNIGRGYGTVQANEYTGLFGYDPADEDCVVIGGTALKCTDEAALYLGYDVTYYYDIDKSGGKPTLLHVKKEEEQKVNEIKAEDIVSVSNGTIEYETEGRKKRVTIAAGASVIINGVRKTYFTDSDLKPKSGKITVLNSGGIVLIESYKNIYVKRVTKNDGVYNIVGDNGENIKLDMNEDSESHIVLMDRNLDFSEITQGMVLSLFADNLNIADNTISGDIKLCRIYASTKTVTTAVTKIVKDKIYGADGTEYKYAFEFDSVKNPINAGDTVKLILNSFNEIVKRDDSVSARDYKYGFITGVKSISSFGDSYEIKIFDEDGEFYTYEFTNRCRIDGINKSGKDIYTALANSGSYYKKNTSIALDNANGFEQLVRYKTKDNKVSFIDTIIADYNNSDAEKTCLRMAKNYDGKAASKPRFSIWAGTVNFFTSGLGVDSSCVYFFLPKDAADEESYMIRNLKTGNTQWRISNPMSFFDPNDIGKISCAVEYGEKFNTTVEEDQIDYLMIVKDIMQSINSEGEQTLLLSGFKINNGSEIELQLLNKAVADGIDIKEGDIIGWNPDAKDRAVAIRKVMSVPNSDGSLKDDTDDTVINKSNPANTDFEDDGLIYATPLQTDSQYWRWATKPETEEFYMQLISPIRATLIYDASKRADKISKSAVSEIRTTELYGSKSDKILILIDEYRAYSCVIYRMNP